MRIAFSTEENNGIESAISHHFGRCPYYVFVDVEDRSVKNIEGVENPYFNEHRPGAVPQFISEKGADIMVAGGMGPRAVSLFEQFNITPVVGFTGPIKMVLPRIIHDQYTKVTSWNYDPSKHDQHKGEIDHPCQ